MNTSALTASIPSCATLRSLEATVVPHFVEVTAGARGTVTSNALAEVLWSGTPVRVEIQLSARRPEEG